LRIIFNNIIFYKIYGHVFEGAIVFQIVHKLATGSIIFLKYGVVNTIKFEGFDVRFFAECPIESEGCFRLGAGLLSAGAGLEWRLMQN